MLRVNNRTQDTDEFLYFIGRTYKDSTPWWPEAIKAPAGAPNIIMIVLDDAGFGQIGSYGGPIETPNIDKLAANGLRYDDIQTTAICSPTRKCLLMGRSRQSVGMASITEQATGFPGHNGMMREYGFNTFCAGGHMTDGLPGP